ncbi:MAG: aspartate/glutamate racemase family protein [Treponema sp.]|nr:aspartate/glutamate racemase family protein [Treponema sp.]
MNKYKDAIGILGGMGSYATLDFFNRVLNFFPCEKEWERPRVLIDNNCVMPSRVRAILYNENVEELKSALYESVKGMLSTKLSDGGKLYIVIGCNTAHNYLGYLKERLPQANFVDIIDACADDLEKRGVKEVSVLATEGTVATKIYNDYFDKRGIRIFYRDSEDEQKQVRYLIECVKQNKMTDDAKKQFACLINSCVTDNVILGCTELPVLWNTMDKGVVNKTVFDPLECALFKLKDMLK